MNLARAHVGTKRAMETERFDEFSSVVERYQSLVWAVAYSITGDPSLSEDVAQETFLAVWNQQGDIRDLGNLKGYLATIARNLGRKAMRGTGREVMEGDCSAQAEEASVDTRGPLDEVLKREELSQVAVALGQMPIPSREAFVLFYAEGQSVAGVADKLNLSQSAVKQRLYRARESLKGSLETTLSQAITAGTPGRVFAAATMTFILSQGAAAAAAASHASVGHVPGPEALAKMQGLRTSSFGISGKMVGAVVCVASAAVAVLLAQATVGGDSGKEPPTDPNIQSEAIASPSGQDPSPIYSLHHQNRPPNSAGTKVPVATERAVGQGLFASRILEYSPSADLDRDGQLSEDEIHVLRETQEDELAKQILRHWQDETCTCGREPARAHGRYGVTCAFVGQAEGGQLEEGWMPYNLPGLRMNYEKELKAGPAMSAKQWLLSQIASVQKEKVCQQVTARLHDNVQALRAEANGAPLPWVASVPLEEGQALRFPPPKELRRELTTVANYTEANEVAIRWGVELLVRVNSRVQEESNAPRYIFITYDEPDIAAWEELPLADQAALETAKSAGQVEQVL